MAIEYNTVRTIAEQVVREAAVNEPYQVQTTDGTELTVATIVPEVDEVGLLEIKALAKESASTGALQIIVHVGYSNLTGTLVVSILQTLSQVDAAIAGANVSAIAVAGNAEVRVTGVAATTIDWDVYVSQTIKPVAALP